MDTTAGDITFDEDGVCNYCKDWHINWEHKVDRRPIEVIIDELLENRRDGKYDAVLGLSGGVDSSELARLVWKHGLNVLLVHADSGWNTKAAWLNVQNIVNTTGFDFFHPRFNHREYRDIINSYLKASVVGLEAPTDNILRTFCYQACHDNKIHSLLNGGNFITEGFLPSNWGYDNGDATNILDIHKRHGTIPLKETKLLNLFSRTVMHSFKGFKEFRLLNHVDPPYNKFKAKEDLAKEFGWIDYGRKHSEDRYTKFVESYIFPKKFGFDKRRAHYSCLICAGQLTREEALKELEIPHYTPEEEASEKEYFTRVLGITIEFLDEYIATPPRSHYEYKTNELTKKTIRLYKRAKQVIR